MKKLTLSKVLKSTVALVLVLSMFLMAGCKKNTDKPSNNGASNTPTAGADSDGGSGDSDDNAGSNENASYTYNTYDSGSPKTWNVHEWETNTDSFILNYTTMGFYDIIMNDTKDGYKFVPEMASGEPVDVTAEYAGNETYGVPADASSGYAFKIALNEGATWENGDAINADSYIYSLKAMLDPQMKNYRASGYYSGTMTIANAEQYYKQNSPIYTPVYDSAASAYRDVADADMHFSLTQTVAFFSDSAQAYYNAGYESNFLDADGNDLFAKYSESDYNPLTEEAKADLLLIASSFGDTNPEAYKEFCFTYDGVSESVDWENVGLKKTGDYEITLVLSKPITDFYLHYNLTSNWLVHEATYEANKKETGDLVKTTYGTAVDNYISYGPYKLTEYQTDKQITMVKNENWYGYTDGNHEGQYQTTAISCQIVAQQATALQLFLQGKLDTVSLVAEDMATYRTSDYILYTPQSYTSKLTFNSSYTALKGREADGVNRTILSYKDFRKAFSLSIDRAEFAAQCTATHSAGFGLLNYMYVADPDTGTLYRDTEAAKNVLLSLYGVSDEDSITGYNKTEAATLFESAYQEALAAGDIKENDIVELEFLVYKQDEAYVKIVNFIQEAINAATVGTSLENRVTLKMTPDEDYYDHAKQGAFEIIISTWGGSSMDPFGIAEVYCVEDTMNEYGFKPNTEKLTINVNGEELTKTFYEWYDALCNGEYAAADVDTRVQVLAGIESGILNTYNTTPLYYRTAASLDSRKVIQGTDTYIQMVEFGGIRFLTYAYDDAAWETYCTENNNQLTY